MSAPEAANAAHGAERPAHEVFAWFSSRDRPQLARSTSLQLVGPSSGNLVVRHTVPLAQVLLPEIGVNDQRLFVFELEREQFGRNPGPGQVRRRDEVRHYAGGG